MEQTTPNEREADIVHTMIRLADTLVTDYDEFELLRDLTESSVRILDGDAAGISLATGDKLAFVIASDESTEIVELFQAQHQQGPCVDAYTSGEAVHSDDIRRDCDMWPDWAPQALDQGFRSADAFPLHLHGETIGALNMFTRRRRELRASDRQVGEALADMATIGMLHQRSSASQDTVREQLQRALDWRVIIEQAKGTIGQRHSIPPDEAFERLRHYARSNNRKIHEVAHEVVHEHLDW